MKINNKDFCNNIVECPLFNEEDNNTFKHSTYLKINIGNNEDNAIKVNILCLFCKHAKKIDVSEILKKISTTDLLKEGN